jgi:hypothetical protein
VPTPVTTSLTDCPVRCFAGWNGHRLDGVDGPLAPELSWSDPSLPAGKAFDVLGTDVFTADGEGQATTIRVTAIRGYYDGATPARQLGLV